MCIQVRLQDWVAPYELDDRCRCRCGCRRLRRLPSLQGADETGPNGGSGDAAAAGEPETPAAPGGDVAADQQACDAEAEAISVAASQAALAQVRAEKIPLLDCGAVTTAVLSGDHISPCWWCMQQSAVVAMPSLAVCAGPKYSSHRTGCVAVTFLQRDSDSLAAAVHGPDLSYISGTGCDARAAGGGSDADRRRRQRRLVARSPRCGGAAAPAAPHAAGANTLTSSARGCV